MADLLGRVASVLWLCLGPVAELLGWNLGELAISLGKMGRWPALARILEEWRDAKAYYMAGTWTAAAVRWCHSWEFVRRSVFWWPFRIAMYSSTLYRMACEHHKLTETLLAADTMRKEVGKITYIAKHAQRSDRWCVGYRSHWWIFWFSHALFSDEIAVNFWHKTFVPVILHRN